MAICGFVLAAPSNALTAKQTKSTCTYDDSYSYNICLYMNYNTETVNSRFYAQLVSYQLRISGAKQVNVSIPKATVNTGANGSELSGSCIDCTQYYHPTNLSPNVTYTYTPYWVGKWVNVATETGAGAGFFQCANADVYFKHGSTTWDTYTGNLCVGDPIAPNPFG